MLERGTLDIFGWGCAAETLKSLPYTRSMNITSPAVIDLNRIYHRGKEDSLKTDGDTRCTLGIKVRNMHA